MCVPAAVVAVNVNAFPVKHCVNEGTAENAGDGPAGVVTTCDLVV